MKKRVIANTREVLKERKKNGEKHATTYNPKYKPTKERLKARISAHMPDTVKTPPNNRKSLREIRKWAFRSGIMPHEFMLRLMRGEKVDGYKCSIQERIDIAKAVAPYFVPKLQNIAHTGEDNEGPVRMNSLNISTHALKSLDNVELDLLEKVVGKLEGSVEDSEGSSSGGKTIEGDAQAYSASINDES